MNDNSTSSCLPALIERRLKLFKHYKINLLFDVGANTGGYGQIMRKFGFQGRIVSFEPLCSAFKKLKEKVSKDSLWQVENFALGNREGKSKINVSKNSVSSSILEMLQLVTNVAPDAGCIGSEEIKIYRFDDVFHRYYRAGDSVFLKIDTQGYEKKILKGAVKSLKNIAGLQVETSLVPLYQGETLMHDLVRFIKKLGYTMMSIEPGFHNPATGQLLQADLIFFK
jgi:FkbM family methyltransferase